MGYSYRTSAPRVSFFYACGTSYLIDLFGIGYSTIGGGNNFYIPGVNGGSATWDGAPKNDPFPSMLDPTLFDAKKITPFADALFPMKDSVTQGVASTIAMIKATPGPFCLGGYSQGAMVMSQVYNEIRSGSLTARASDFLGAVTFGNPFREINHTWPGSTWSGSWDAPGSTSGGHGCFPSTYRLSGTEAKWWDFANVNDIITAVSDTTAGVGEQNLVGLLTEYWDGISMTSFLTTYFATAGFPNLASAQAQISSIVTAVAGGGGGHVTYPIAPPPGNPQNGLTSYQIALNYLHSLALSWRANNNRPGVNGPARCFPPGQISLLGENLLVQNTTPHITYVGHEQTPFYIAGPLAPTPGAQNGISALSISGLTPPFQHVDNQGARQDGITYLDSVYDPAEIDVQVEASGLTANDMRDVMRSWIGASDAKRQGRLSVFTPDNGEWWAKVRELKTFTDPITQSGSVPGTQRFTWAWRNDDAFWQSFDSVATFQLGLQTVSDTFTGSANTTLGANWTQTYSGAGGAGVCGLTGNGNANWQPSGSAARQVINRHNTTSTTDNQVVSVQFAAPVGFDLLGGVYIDILARMNSTSTDYIRARIGGNGVLNTITLSSFIGGAETVLWWQPLLIPPVWNETWTLICGTTNGARNFKIQRGDYLAVGPVLSSLGVTIGGTVTVVDFTEKGTQSGLGSTHRGWGWGMAAGPGILPPYLDQVPPPNIELWAAGDNTGVSQNGFLPLVNRGDQDGWPRYLLYGPGTFTLSDGPAHTGGNTVTFGPLLEGQVAMLTTLPRLRGVVDLSPNQPAQTSNIFQSLMSELVSFATNNNVPPLLEQFESVFGILPPQGNMYSLLNGRFTTPVPPKFDSQPPVVSNIAVSIANGNASSKVVAALTPQRRWPL